MVHKCPYLTKRKHLVLKKKQPEDNKRLIKMASSLIKVYNQN